MSNEVLGQDDYIPDFELDGSEVKESDLADRGAGVEIKGYYHLELIERSIIAEEGKVKHLNMRLQVLSGEHDTEFNKTVWHRMYLEKNEYETDDNGKVVEEEKTRNDGTTYQQKKKTGKILPLVAGDKIIGGHGRFCIGLGLLTEAEVAGKKFKLPLSLINPGIQFIALVGANGEIEWNKTFTLDNEEMKDIPKDEAAMLVFKAGASGVSQEAIDSI